MSQSEAPNGGERGESRVPFRPFLEIQTEIDRVGIPRTLEDRDRRDALLLERSALGRYAESLGVFRQCDSRLNKEARRLVDVGNVEDQMVDLGDQIGSISNYLRGEGRSPLVRSLEADPDNFFTTRNNPTYQAQKNLFVGMNPWRYRQGLERIQMTLYDRATPGGVTAEQRAMHRPESWMWQGIIPEPQVQPQERTAAQPSQPTEGTPSSDAARVIWENRELPASTGRAFSRRWTRRHGVPDVILANPLRGINQDIYPSEALSDVADVGQNSLLAEELRNALTVTRNRGVRNAVIAGLLPLLSLNRAMEASRITTVAGIVGTKSDGGREIPRGISQFLMADDETRRVLALLFRMQGYRVAAEPGVNDRVPESLPNVNFADFANLKPDGSADDLERTLERVRLAINVEGADGTDPGVVIAAFTIFRYLGFAHGNKKFVEIREKHTQRLEHGELVGFYLPETLAPFVDKLSVRRETLSEIIASRGILGLAAALGKIDTEEVGRWWDDTLTMLDGADAASDLLNATGGAALLTNPEDRRKALFRVEQVITLLNKRRISLQEAQRFVDIRNAYLGKTALQPANWWEEDKTDLRRLMHQLGLGGLIGEGKRPDPKGK